METNGTGDLGRQLAELLTDAASVAAVQKVLAGLAEAASEAEAVDRIAALESLKSVCAAVQARESVALDRMRREREAAEGVPVERQGRGLGAEVALARREPAHSGGRHLGLARALCQEMPHTLGALTGGEISEHQATVLVGETAWLSVEDRAEVDRLMAHRLGQVGTRRLAAEARAHAQRLDQESAVAHLERSRRERRVSVRPATGGMAYLTALLPLQQAVAAMAGLQRDAGTIIGTGDPDGRTRDQVTADLLVERVTGQCTAAAVPIELHLVMTDRALFGPGEDPAWLPGHGPMPAEAARRMLADPEGEVFLRRLFTRPEDGQLVGMDSRARVFPPLLRRMIVLRDDVCRTPWCDAPIRHADHISPHAAGGATSLANGQGLCAACNYAKENPGWRHRTREDGGGQVTTPTGHTYRVAAAPLTVWAGTPPGLPDDPEGQGTRDGPELDQMPEGQAPDGAPAEQAQRAHAAAAPDQKQPWATESGVRAWLRGAPPAPGESAAEAALACWLKLQAA